MVNLPELAKRLQVDERPHEWGRVQAENLSFAEKLRYFSTLRVMVAEWGSIFGNFYFWPAGVRFVILLPSWKRITEDWIKSFLEGVVRAREVVYIEGISTESNKLFTENGKEMYGYSGPWRLKQTSMKKAVQTISKMINVSAADDASEKRKECLHPKALMIEEADAKGTPIQSAPASRSAVKQARHEPAAAPPTPMFFYSELERIHF